MIFLNTLVQGMMQTLSSLRSINISETFHMSNNNTLKKIQARIVNR